MKIYIELFIPAVLFLILVVWWIWNRMSIRRAWKKYNPDDDKSRKREGERDRAVEQAAPGATGPSEPAERPVLQAADPGADGKNSKRSRNPFKRRKRR